MSQLVAVIVDLKALWETVVASLIAGVGITFIFTLGLLGAARFSELSRDSRPAAATAWGVLGVLGGITFVAAIVAGIVVMTTK